MVDTCQVVPPPHPTHSPAAGVQSVREAAGSSLRDELAVTLPPRKGTIVFTEPHQLKAQREWTAAIAHRSAHCVEWRSLSGLMGMLCVCVGMCHLVMGSTHRPLEQACLKALEHAHGFQYKKLVSA